MSEFPKIQQAFLEETVWMHGLGYSSRSPKCGLCRCAVGAEAASSPGVEPQRFFRCGKCGVFLQCKECCLERHILTPLHFLEVRMLRIILAARLTFIYSRNGLGSFGLALR